MAAARLLTAGEAFEDLVFVGLERLPGPGEELKTDTFHSAPGGGAVITAVAAARLGLPTAIASAMSDAAVTRLRHERVRVTNLLKRGEPHAITAALSTPTDRTFVTFNGVNTVLEPRLLRAVRDASARHIHLALCPRNLPAWTRAVARLRRRGTTVSWDFGWNESLAEQADLPPLMDALDLVFLNELEAPLYARTNTLDEAYVRLRTPRSNVVVKLGAVGSRWLRQDGDVVMPAPHVAGPVDVTGAGDAFNAGFLVAWLEGAPPGACLATGNAVGAASTRAAGGLDALPRLRDLPPMLRPGAPGRASAGSRVPPDGARRVPANSRRRRTTP